MKRWDKHELSCINVLKHMLHNYEGRLLLDLIVRVELVVITLTMKEGV